MLVKIIKDFKDIKRRKRLVKVGSLLNYEDDERAKELIKAGVAEIAKIENIETKKQTTKKPNSRK